MPRQIVAALLVGVVLVAGACSGDTKEVGGADARDASTTTTRTDRSDVDDPDVSGGSDGAGDAASSGSGGAASGATGGGSRSGGASSSGDASGGADGGGDGSTSDGGSGGGGQKDPAPPATAPPSTFTPDPGGYPRYVELAREYRAEVLGQGDADAQASVFCSDPEGSSQEFLGGAPLDAYPSDLAIVRAYCPEAEAKF